jgi:uncharacterized delta-60 repeat protein
VALKHRRNAFFSSLFLIAGAFGCQAILGIDDTSFEPDSGLVGDGGSGDASSSNDGALPSDAGSPSLSISPTSVRVLPGASVDVAVTIVRGGVSGIVTVSADDLDAGVGIASTTIADGQSTGTLHVTVSPSSKPGSQDVATIHATLAGTSAVPLTIFVPGPPGTIDETFANGEAAFPLGDAGITAQARGLGVQSDGKIVIGAEATGTVPDGWTIIRLDQTGAMDPTFNANALVATPSTGILAGVVVGPLDDIWVVGTSNNQMTVVHLNADGTRDNKFGTLGIATLNPVDYSNGSTGASIAVQSDDRPIVVGVDRQGNLGLVVRFTLDGLVDTTFGSSGRTLLDTFHFPANVRVLPDDSIVATGTDQSSGIVRPVFVLRMTKGGAIDTTYGPNGYVDGTQSPWTGLAVGYLPDAGFVVVGADQGGQIQGTASEFPLAGGDASVETHVAAPVNLNTSITTIAVQPDNRFLITGNGGGSFDHTTFLLRMLSPTTPDPSFNDAGGVVFFADHSMPSSIPYRFFFATAFTPDGRIVAGGNQQNSGIFVVRVWL